ncbi:MAG: hypothetical protein ACC628_23840, partial [Pirellulaceae bacterium]
MMNKPKSDSSELFETIKLGIDAHAKWYFVARQLEVMGVTNYVVQPQNWDERGKGVKNDRIDALALCQRLDRF